MNGKDITQKMLERYNDVFADIVNVLLFNGKRIVDEDALIDTPADSALKIDGEIPFTGQRCCKVLEEQSNQYSVIRT